MGFGFRWATCAVMFIGWLNLAWLGKTATVVYVVLFLTLVGAAIIGHRSTGSILLRLIRSAGFFLGGGYLAVFSVAFSRCLNYPQAETGQGLESVNLGALALALLELPVAMVIGVLMLRAWTWSAHDQQILRGLAKESVQGPEQCSFMRPRHWGNGNPSSDVSWVPTPSPTQGQPNSPHTGTRE